MNYRLIISDYDGTLRRDDGSIGAYTLDAIEEFRRQGGIFAICSGRMTSSVLEIANRLGLNGLAVSFQGSVITDMETGETLMQKSFTEEEAKCVVSFMEKEGYRIHLYTHDAFYANYDTEELHAYERLVNGKARIVSDLSNLLEERSFPVIKVLAMVDSKDKIAVYRKLCEGLDDRFYVTYSAASLVEVTPISVNKGVAVRFLADYYNIPMEKTIAIGDNLNDSTMLEAAGLGVAVANAADELKERADLVSEYSNEADCVGHIVRKYGLGG
ncbi:MAG: HAD family phosphatase [Clostridia bacterium]|nr:HAD family phosphatase [Clostridia bacterium]